MKWYQATVPATAWVLVTDMWPNEPSSVNVVGTPPPANELRLRRTVTGPTFAEVDATLKGDAKVLLFPATAR